VSFVFLLLQGIATLRSGIRLGVFARFVAPLVMLISKNECAVPLRLVTGVHSRICRFILQILRYDAGQDP
jgi:hypothetical protein